jgi:hypothetical protein
MVTTSMQHVTRGPTQCSKPRKRNTITAYWNGKEKIKVAASTKYWQGHGTPRTLTHSWQKYNMVQSLWKTFWQFLKKLHTYNMTHNSTPKYLLKKINKYPHKNLPKYIHSCFRAPD